MAKQKKERAAWEVDFVSVPLSREDVDACKKWDLDYSLSLKAVDNALFKACKVSLTYNVTTSSYIASITVPNPQTGSEKKCFTSHAPDLMDAIKIMAYKIETVLDGNPFNLHSVEPTANEWG